MKAIFLFLAIALSVSLTGCETMEGVGKDIQNLGEKIEKKAKGSESE